MPWSKQVLEGLSLQRSYLDQPSHALKLFCSCLFLFSLPCPRWAGCSLHTAIFVSVIISIVICPLSDPLPGRARKHPSVSVFNNDGAPSSSSSEKTKTKQAHNESDVSLLASPLISPSHFSHGANFCLFPPVCLGCGPGSASRGVWPAPLGVSGSSAVGKADRAPLAPTASSKHLQEAWPPDTGAWDQLQAKLEVHDGSGKQSGQLGGGKLNTRSAYPAQDVTRQKRAKGWERVLGKCCSVLALVFVFLHGRGEVGHSPPCTPWVLFQL